MIYFDTRRREDDYCFLQGGHKEDLHRYRLTQNNFVNSVCLNMCRAIYAIRGEERRQKIVVLGGCGQTTTFCYDMEK